MCIVFYAYIPLLHHLKFKGVRQGLGGAKTPFATPQKCLWLCTIIIIIIISFMMYTHQRTDGNLYQQPIITNYKIS